MSDWGTFKFLHQTFDSRCHVFPAVTRLTAAAVTASEKQLLCFQPAYERPDRHHPGDKLPFPTNLSSELHTNAPFSRTICMRRVCLLFYEQINQIYTITIEAVYAFKHSCTLWMHGNGDILRVYTIHLQVKYPALMCPHSYVNNVRLVLRWRHSIWIIKL